MVSHLTFIFTFESDLLRSQLNLSLKEQFHAVSYIWNGFARRRRRVVNVNETYSKFM
jgi:hypothetical protein